MDSPHVHVLRRVARPAAAPVLVLVLPGVTVEPQHVADILEALTADAPVLVRLDVPEGVVELRALLRDDPEEPLFGAAGPCEVAPRLKVLPRARVRAVRGRGVRRVPAPAPRGHGPPAVVPVHVVVVPRRLGGVRGHWVAQIARGHHLPAVLPPRVFRAVIIAPAVPLVVPAIVPAVAEVAAVVLALLLPRAAPRARRRRARRGGGGGIEVRGLDRALPREGREASGVRRRQHAVRAGVVVFVAPPAAVAAAALPRAPAAVRAVIVGEIRTVVIVDGLAPAGPAAPGPVPPASCPSEEQLRGPHVLKLALTGETRGDDGARLRSGHDELAARHLRRTKPLDVRRGPAELVHAVAELEAAKAHVVEVGIVLVGLLDVRLVGVVPAARPRGLRNHPAVARPLLSVVAARHRAARALDHVRIPQPQGLVDVVEGHLPVPIHVEGPQVGQQVFLLATVERRHEMSEHAHQLPLVEAPVAVGVVLLECAGNICLLGRGVLGWGGR
mmetsp:Transcript_61920/g.195692  ORF Transcript_61920/g.195692 Transcript_61920/m.195692 type:complete len:500 (-) Transcript_61920:46-1545(-)